MQATRHLFTFFIVILSIIISTGILAAPLSTTGSPISIIKVSVRSEKGVTSTSSSKVPSASDTTEPANRESVPGYKPDSAIENARKLLAGKCQNTRKAAGRSKISQRADFAWSDEDEDEDEDKEGEDEDDDEGDSTDENEDEEEKACEFIPLKNNDLKLAKTKTSPLKSGKLGKAIASGRDGKVFDVDSWPSTTEPVVAKWFNYIGEGGLEIDNLKTVDELVDWGYLYGTQPSLWAIMYKKIGVPLNVLQSYKDSVLDIKQEWTVCTQYMKDAREAIVEASRHYIKMKGSPVHDDLQIENVLFREEKVGGKNVLRAQLVDWRQMKLSLKKGQIPTPEEVEKIAADLMKKLEAGITWKDSEPGREKFSDFSNHHQCYQVKPASQAKPH